MECTAVLKLYSLYNFGFKPKTLYLNSMANVFVYGVAIDYS